MNRQQFNTAVASAPNGRVIAMLDTNDELLVLPDSALSWRRAAKLEADGCALLGAYTGPQAWEYVQEDVTWLKSAEEVPA